MSTLLEAAQGVVDSANRLGTTNTMMLPYYLIEALEQAIAQEQSMPMKLVSGTSERICSACKYIHKHADAEPCNTCSEFTHDNWEPKP